ncbi:MAG: MFS transporter [Acidobacteria bacterium]|nr:MFS transporter [Acidobacteriota bacterium]
MPRWRDWLGINRSTLAVLVVVGGLGLSEELWRNFLSVYLNVKTGDVGRAVGYMGVYAFFANLAEGFGYVLGGRFAHRLGARAALAISAIPMAAGFALLLWTQQPWAIVLGALLLTNWEPLSVPATFEVVGAEVAANRRTIAFAVQSIQKRLPKVLGPLIGGFAFAVGYWVNLSLAVAVLGAAVLTQAVLLRKMKARPDPDPSPARSVLRQIPPELKQLLSAEILLRWGDWFVRDFAALYVVAVLGRSPAEYGMLASLTAFTALATYIPVGKLVDRSKSPKPFIGLTFALFALFPFSLVLLPKTGLPVMAALVAAFVLNGLREIGEPARKAAITTGMPAEIRARAVGWYWGLRSVCFCPAPLAAWWLWERVGPEAAFLTGGTIGMIGTVWFLLRVRLK